MTIRGIVLSSLVVLMTTASQANPFESASLPAEKQYFMKLYSYQGKPNSAPESHTFAQFYSSSGQRVTISWLPRTGVVRRFGSEPGKNFSLSETFRFARNKNKKVGVLGPYQIKKSLFLAAQKRARQLRSGRLKYSMLGLSAGAPNCIHAVGDIVGRVNTGASWGHSATRKVLRHFTPWIIKK